MVDLIYNLHMNREDKPDVGPITTVAKDADIKTVGIANLVAAGGLKRPGNPTRWHPTRRRVLLY